MHLHICKVGVVVMVSIDNLLVSILVTLVTLIYTGWNKVYLLSLCTDWYSINSQAFILWV